MYSTPRGKELERFWGRLMPVPRQILGSSRRFTCTVQRPNLGLPVTSDHILANSTSQTKPTTPTVSSPI